MTDDEILAHQRVKHGNYMPLSMAKKMQREESKWRHLKKTTPADPCRYRDGTCLTHSGEQTG